MSLSFTNFLFNNNKLNILKSVNVDVNFIKKLK